MTCAVLFALFLVQLSYGISTGDITVCLSELGCVLGTYLPGYQTDQYEAFLGIPFAEPPIGPLRFKNPVPMKPWNSFLATKMPKPDCIQKNYLLDDWYVTGEEDCLYMNIYRPVERPDKPLPVMFYIFGGGFFMGSISPDEMDPAYFMDRGDVILVVANYRLGPFGFLSTGSSEMPGNLGLKDQQLALKWVQVHIGAFGGDPQSVTISGHSTGAASVHFHMLSEGSRELFHAAILASGNALAPYVDIIKEPYQQVLKMAEFLEIDNAAAMDEKYLVEVLQSFDSYTLLTAGDALKSWHRFPLFNFRPNIEEKDWPDAFLTDTPKALMKNGQTFQVPTLQSLINNRGEGAVYTLHIWTHQDMRDEFNADFDGRLWDLMELSFDCNPETCGTILNSIVDEYFGGIHELSNATIGGFTQLFSDIAFYYPFWKYAKYSLMHEQPSAPLYVAKFSYNGPKTFAFAYNGGPPIQYGAVHKDEFIYLFRIPATFPVDFEKESVDARLVKDLVDLYVEFAKNGKVKDLNACTYENFNSPNEGSICDYVEFLNHIGTGYERVIHNEFNTKRMQFWDKILGDSV